MDEQKVPGSDLSVIGVAAPVVDDRRVTLAREDAGGPEDEAGDRRGCE